MWADAICINQADTIERNEHVLRIGDVYQAAWHVICWLGDSSHESSRAISLVSRISQKWAESNTDRMLFNLQESPDLLIQADWLALGQFMNRSYWDRLWIKQELALARFDTPMLCGKDVLAWGQLHDTIWSAAYSSLAYVEELVRQDLVSHGIATPSSRDDPLRRKQIYQLSVLQYKIRDAKTIAEKDGSLMHRLPAVLDLSRVSKATEDRDKVFGITSLLPSIITSQLKIDYEMEVNQVYKDLTIAIIESTQKLDILDHCKSTPGQNSNTWVPDWRIAHTRIWPGIKRQMPYNACGETPATIVFSNDQQLLHVKGLRVDGIREKRMITHSRSNKISQEQDSLNVDKNQLLELRNSFWRTITGNINTNGEPAPDDFVSVLDLIRSDYTQSEHVTGKFALKRLDYFERFMDQTDDLLVEGCSIRALIQDVQSPKASSHPFNRLAMEQALDRIYRSTQSRKLVVTDEGKLCLVPQESLPLDIIVVLFGCSMPVVLRPKTKEETYSVVGTCYHHGFMNGEAVKGKETGLFTTQTFAIG